MKRLLDVMYYKYVLDEASKKSRTVLEDVASVPRKDKVLGLLAEHANIIARTIAAHENLTSATDAMLQQALSDPKLREAVENETDLAQAVGETKIAQELLDEYEQTEQDLLSFERQFAEALTQEDSDGR